jgi:NADH-quinone oxidoreductase subunit J
MEINLFGVSVPLPTLGQMVFAAAAGLAILGSVMMITRRNAVHSALWLVLVFFQLAIMYVMLGAEFLAALQVLVYTGAILVLFLFVIMLLGLSEHPQLSDVHRAQMITAWPVGLILMVEILTVILLSNQPPQAALGDLTGGNRVVWSIEQIMAVGGNIQALGRTLYTQFLLPFEAASLILLVAVLGAIVLARKEEPVEVEEILPAVGISLARRAVADSPQEEQIEKKLLPALGITEAPDVDVEEIEVPVVEQPSGIGAGTTAGVEVQEPLK